MRNKISKKMPTILINSMHDTFMPFHHCFEKYSKPTTGRYFCFIYQQLKVGCCEDESTCWTSSFYFGFVSLNFMNRSIRWAFRFINFIFGYLSINYCNQINLSCHSRESGKSGMLSANLHSFLEVRSSNLTLPI